MGDWQHRPTAMMREEYVQLDEAGQINRPLTWGPQRRHNNEGALAPSAITPVGCSTGGQTQPAPTA